MGTSIRRSTLILPVNIPHFVEKAYQRGADGVLLDLEDSVPPQEKESARRLIKDSIPVAARGGAEVFVRVNKAPDLLEEDLAASVHPGLDGITFPKQNLPRKCITWFGRWNPWRRSADSHRAI